MDFTARLKLPYLQGHQAQKHVTYNDALQQIDVLVQATVLQSGAVSPPGAPDAGDAYLMGAAATGAWAGAPEHSLAFFADGAWQFISPSAGWRVWDLAAGVLKAYEPSTGWQSVTGAVPQRLPALGINADAAPQQKLNVASDSVRFSFDPAGAAGDMRAYVNKSTLTATASLLFANANAAKAEIGLCGSDVLQAKVSVDAVSWKTAFAIDPQTSFLGLGTASPFARLDVTATDTPKPALAAGTLARFFAASGQQTSVMADAIQNNADFSMRRANGSVGMPTTVTAGNNLGQISWIGFDGAAYSVSQARIQADAAENWTTTAHGTHLDFAVTATGTVQRSKRMRLTSAGFVGLRDDLAPVCKLDVDGAVRVGVYAKAALPMAAAGAGQIIYVSDDAGGSVLAFSDGSAWRRVTDRAVIS